MHRQKINLTGSRFGKLLVVAETSNVGKNTVWRCLCDCGKETIVQTRRLQAGRTKSCGCLKIKHNESKTRLYRIWNGIKTRTTDPFCRDAKRYFHRGIKMCPLWENDFIRFRDWALRSGYKDDLECDRKENDVGYCPFNCQWITKSENISKCRREEREERTNNGHQTSA